VRLSYQNFIVQAKADDVDRFVVDVAKTLAGNGANARRLLLVQPLSSTEQQQATDDQHHSSRAAMDAEGGRSGAALVQDDRGVTDRYDSGRQHKPTKRVCGPVSDENGDEQSRCDVSNTFR
jgi:hypothetical protein